MALPEKKLKAKTIPTGILADSKDKNLIELFLSEFCMLIKNIISKKKFVNKLKIKFMVFLYILL